LENIVDVLRKHPTMVIKIESHTDSRGSDRYNMKLSDRRAKSTRDYLLSRGIAPSRIESAIGYGETQLLNKCANRVRCSEEEHQLNRRSYFYIVKN
jgi:outer membrane protein OmpA-like peptidoglycan-associated protein